jgi:fructokinase
VKKGAIGIKNSEIVECSAKKDLNIVDLTGAGDLFAAGYLHGQINNLSLKESLLSGAELSSKVIQQIGARIKNY